jgi:NADH-quinone oxidoreductase subunit H
VSIASQLLQLIIFPGLAFCLFLGTIFEWIDRIVYARLQNRMGPPWYQPIMDVIKLFAKEDILVTAGNSMMTGLMGIISVASATAAVMYMPIIGVKSAYPFEGDLIVVLFLLTIPTVTFFLAGWYSANPFGIVGGMRAATQFLAYEIPLTMAIIAPALMAGTWSISGIVEWSHKNPFMLIPMLIGLGVAVIALQGKLERVPFDSPEAETEVVGGTFTEFSGRRYAMFRIATDIEMVAGSILLANLYLGGAWGPSWMGWLAMLVESTLIVFVLSIIRAVTARLRINQVVQFCWSVLVPVSALQIAIVFLLREMARI